MKTDNNAYPVRVLCLFTLLDRGGAETMCMNLYRNIDRTKVQFDFLVYYPQRGEYEDEIETLGGHVYRIPHLDPKNLIAHIQGARSFFREHPEYKIIHNHMGENGALICHEAKRAGVRTIIYHSHVDLAPLIIKQNEVKQSNGNQKTSNPLFCYIVDKKELKLRLLYPIAMRSSTNYFACGENAAKVFRWKKDAAIIIKNGINIERFMFNKNLRERKRKELACGDKFIVGNVARLNANKNQNFAIEIMRELVKLRPNAEMWFVGQGPILDALQVKTHQLNLQDKIRFLGVRSDVNELLQAMDVFLFPSISEGLPVSCVEAQAAGLPCVFSDGFDPNTVITENCKVISLQQNPKNWAEAINSFVNFRREDTSGEIRNAGYDVQETAKWLERFYLSSGERI